MDVREGQHHELRNKNKSMYYQSFHDFTQSAWPMHYSVTSADILLTFQYFLCTPIC